MCRHSSLYLHLHFPSFHTHSISSYHSYQSSPQCNTFSWSCFSYTTFWSLHPFLPFLPASLSHPYSRTLIVFHSPCNPNVPCIFPSPIPYAIPYIVLSSAPAAYSLWSLHPVGTLASPPRRLASLLFHAPSGILLPKPHSPPFPLLYQAFFRSHLLTDADFPPPPPPPPPSHCVSLSLPPPSSSPSSPLFLSFLSSTFFPLSSLTPPHLAPSFHFVIFLSCPLLPSMYFFISLVFFLTIYVVWIIK